MRSWFSTSAWRSVNMRRARSIVGVRRQAGKASCAARTASSRSAAEESGTRASSAPVAGSVTSRCSLVAASTNCPPT